MDGPVAKCPVVSWPQRDGCGELTLARCLWRVVLDRSFFVYKGRQVQDWEKVDEKGRTNWIEMARKMGRSVYRLQKELNLPGNNHS